ncbi:beta-Ala-His dipeptidase [Peptoniphilus sp. GNH]|nr:Xaa-His dipeptidase [Clostridiales bacterium KA00134]UHR03440.1 beta-Ala-His dipeptidase [Peptoniphilus sp. GNH]
MKTDIERILQHFKNISDIPRGSGNEEKISNYLKAFGENLGLEVVQDDVMNIIIRKQASKGYENSDPVCIQGHMDMVCEKTSDSCHDFLKDPIKNILDKDLVHADKTTLGADNGIALAMAMTILEDKSLDHPALECLFTVEEETSMKGANNLKSSDLKAKFLLNIDSEDEGELTLGSAGGKLYKAEFKSTFENLSNESAYKISLKGLLGGHSGVEIDKPRGNAIKILAKLACELDDIRICDFSAGTKQNAIPNTGYITLASKKEGFLAEIEAGINKIKGEFKNLDGELIFNIEASSEKTALTKEESKRLLGYLLDLYTGLYSKMQEGFLECSCNLAIIRKTDQGFKILNLERSAKLDKLKELDDKLNKTSEKYSVSFVWEGDYPTWEYNRNSRLKDLAMNLYKEETKKDMKISITHGGLECGVFSQTFPHMDIISFGPNIRHAHTPKEYMEVSSVERVYDYTKKLLQRLK